MTSYFLITSLFVTLPAFARPEIHCPDRAQPRIDCQIQETRERVLFCQVDTRLSVIVTSFGMNLVAGVTTSGSVYARTDLSQIEINYPARPPGERYGDLPGTVRFNGREYRAKCTIDKSSRRFGTNESTFPAPARPWP